MPIIKPVSDLRNYNEVLADVRPGSPVYLTKNGRGRYAIIDIADSDDLAFRQRLYEMAELGRKSGEEDGWLTLEEVMGHFDLKLAELLSETPTEGEPDHG